VVSGSQNWANVLDPAATLALAERVVEAAKALGIETALIGAAALAVHRYSRATEDIDLATVVDPRTQLVALDHALAASGLFTSLRLPDDDDPLGGVLVVWAVVDELDEPREVVEIVNFYNPWRIARTPANAAILRSIALPTSALRCVTLEDLIALKLFAGGFSDYADIVQLLARNPDADLHLIRKTGAPFDERKQLESLIQQSAALRI
jgi:hypothetical protein